MQTRTDNPHGSALTEIEPASTESLLLTLQQPVALVGNGCSDRRLGAAIDRHPSIIRFNNYRIQGWEDMVGTRTTLRAVNGWTDLEIRDGVVACSPFTRFARESEHLQSFRSRSVVPVLDARIDVHELLPTIARPSTGLAMAALMSHLGIEVHCFGFDSFRSGHYWAQGEEYHTIHSSAEVAMLGRLPGVTIYGDSFDYAALYDYCHSNHPEYDANEGMLLFAGRGISYRGESILEFGAGNGELSAFLEANGSTVTALEVSPVAFSRIPIRNKILGDALTLCSINEVFDRFVSVDVLEHLTENDVRIVAGEVARIARNITITVCTRPSGLLAADGSNLHLTVKPVWWWKDLFGEWYDLSVSVGHGIGQLLLEGSRRARRQRQPVRKVPSAPSGIDLALPPDYESRVTPEYFIDSVEVTGGVTWQPDVYAIAAQVARDAQCTTIIDLGCGQARKLAELHPEFRVIGVDFGENINWCRSNWKFGSWLESDFEHHELLPIPIKVLDDSIVVCSDVIEHLIDPRPLLATIADLLRHASCAILTTPDRERTHWSARHGPPSNPAHTREWSLVELVDLCEENGLEVISAGHTRSNDVSDCQATSLVMLRMPRQSDTVSERCSSRALPGAIDLIGGAVLEGYQPAAAEWAEPSQTGRRIASAQLTQENLPRFHISVPLEDSRWEVVEAAENEGGVESDVRLFLDAQLEDGDLLVDLDPGFGFVALGAATAPGRNVRVLLSGLSRGTISGWSLSDGSKATGMHLLAGRDLSRLGSTVSKFLKDNSRLFVHCNSGQLPEVSRQLSTQCENGQLLAFCFSDTAYSTSWSLASSVLKSIGYRLTGLVEVNGEVVIAEQEEALHFPVIAIPEVLLEHV